MKYAVGDKVKVVGKSWKDTQFFGRIGTIAQVDVDDRVWPYWIDFKVNIDGKETEQATVWDEDELEAVK